MLETLFENIAAVRKGPACSVGQWESTLDSEDIERFSAALSGDALTSALHRALRTVAGVSFGSATLRRHRNGECACRK